MCDLEAAEEAKDAAMATRALAELKRSQGKVTYEQYVRVLEVRREALEQGPRTRTRTHREAHLERLRVQP